LSKRSCWIGVGEPDRTGENRREPDRTGENRLRWSRSGDSLTEPHLNTRHGRLSNNVQSFSLIVIWKTRGRSLKRKKRTNRSCVAHNSLGHCIIQLVIGTFPEHCSSRRSPDQDNSDEIDGWNRVKHKHAPATQQNSIYAVLQGDVVTDTRHGKEPFPPTQSAKAHGDVRHRRSAKTTQQA